MPAWVVDLVVELTRSIGSLVGAKNDQEREAALMSAAEATKAALDRAKFG